MSEFRPKSLNSTGYCLANLVCFLAYFSVILSAVFPLSLTFSVPLCRFRAKGKFLEAYADNSFGRELVQLSFSLGLVCQRLWSTPFRG